MLRLQKALIIECVVFCNLKSFTVILILLSVIICCYCYLKKDNKITTISLHDILRITNMSRTVWLFVYCYTSQDHTATKVNTLSFQGGEKGKSEWMSVSANDIIFLLFYYHWNAPNRVTAYVDQLVCSLKW